MSLFISSRCEKKKKDTGMGIIIKEIERGNLPWTAILPSRGKTCGHDICTDRVRYIN